MKKLFNSILLIGAVAFLLFSCKKEEQRAVLIPGTAPALTASSTNVTIDSSNGGSNTAITFNWPAVNFGAQVATTYTLQLDSINDDFTKPVNITLGNSLSKTYTAAEFNTLVTSLGLAPTVAGKIHARVKADVNQSNGAESAVPSLYSNVLDITVTPYSTKPQPKFPVPDELYIIGSATPGGDAHGWDNPVPVPSQKFTKIDDNTFGIVLPLIGGKQYLLIPKNGDWSHKYAVSGSTDPMSGNFAPDASDNIPAPATSGVYTIIVDFVKGTYTLTAGNPYKVPSNLYIIGNATPGGDAHGWDNPVPVPSQQFTQTSNGEFTITIPLIGGKSYVFLPTNGDWGHKFGGNSKTEGTLLADSDVPNSNTPAPDASGTYTIDVNFFAKQYKVSQ